MDMAFVETHPFHDEHPIREGTRTLVVGTAPPPRFRNPNCASEGVHPLDFPFFYGSGKNRFWKLMNTIAKSFNAPLPGDDATAAEYQRAACEFLVRHRLWMKDVLQTYERNPECSSSDNDIVRPKDEHLTDFQRVFEEHGSIDRLVFTAQLAAEWTCRSLRMSNSYKQALSTQKRLPDIVSEFDASAECSGYAQKFLAPIMTAEVYGRKVDFFQLPSPSAVRPPSKGVTDECLAKIYKYVLFPH